MSETMQSTDESTRSEVIEAQIESVKNADSLAQTPFSKLFHEARTTTPDTHRTNGYSGVTVQVRVRDGEFEVHGIPVKTRQGEHLRGSDAWDGKISLVVKPFMETKTARSEIIRQLRNLSKKYRRNAQKEAEDPGRYWDSQYERSGDQ
jgi:hypothetical protein